jgi:hypothetical protein
MPSLRPCDILHKEIGIDARFMTRPPRARLTASLVTRLNKRESTAANDENQSTGTVEPGMTISLRRGSKATKVYEEEEKSTEENGCDGLLM